MSIKRMPAAVVTTSCPWVYMASRILHVFERHAGLSGTGDESDPEGVRTDLAGAGQRRS